MAHAAITIPVSAYVSPAANVDANCNYGGDKEGCKRACEELNASGEGRCIDETKDNQEAVFYAAVEDGDKK